MRWLFWSYDIESLDLKSDKDYIISQALNYGTWEDVKWLLQNYSEDEIKEVVKNPQRGIWFEKVLIFWTTIFNIRLKKDIWEKAIFRIRDCSEKKLKNAFKIFIGNKIYNLFRAF